MYKEKNMSKIIVYENEAKQKILSGIDKLEKATSVTLGPAGKNVILDEYGSVHVTKDGITVAKAVDVEDPFENIGVKAVREVAQKSNDKVGDGTTTSTLLAATIFRNGLRRTQLGVNASRVKNGIQAAARDAVDVLSKIVKPVSSKDDVLKVCTVAANGDENIGRLISSLMDKLGKDGVVKVENGNTTEMTSEIVEGLMIDNGYISPYMITSQDTMEADLDNPYVLVANQKMSNIKDMLPMLQSVTATGGSFVIIADDFAEDIVATLVMNKMRGFNVVAIKSPSYGDSRKAILGDIAVAVGGKIVSDEAGVKIQDAVVTSGIIGRAKRVLVTKDSAIIFNGMGDKTAIDERVSAIRNQIANCKSEYEGDKLRTRLGRLTNGIGVINVGADTEAERKERRDRVDDAFCASKAALKSGIVPGGGIALVRVKSELMKKDLSGLDEDERIGYRIFVDALEAPIRKILDNAEAETEQIVMDVSRPGVDAGYGYNVLKRGFVDMFEDGIVDAADVVVNEIQNAASIGSLLLTTECIICDAPKETQRSGCSCGQM